MHSLIQIILHSSPLVVYLLVAIMLLLESCAVPIINTTLLLAAGGLVSLGHLNFWALIAAAILGSITGACLAYLIGLRGGRDIVVRLAMIFRIDTQKIDTTERWFQKTGVWMVFLSRMTPYVRPCSWSSLATGASLDSAFYNSNSVCICVGNCSLLSV